MKRNIALLVLLALLVPAVLTVCSDEPADSAADTTAAEVNETTSEVTTGASSGVPDDLDLGGESVSIWYTTTAASVAETFVSLDPEQTGEILDDAIYNANIATEEKLNVTLDFYNSGVSTSETGTEIRKLILADDTTYNLFHGVQWNARNLVTEGLYLNVRNAPYISFDEPWWDSEYMEETVIGDTLFALVGDYAVDRTRCLTSIYFNKDMYIDFFESADLLYQTVLDGDWTVEVLRKHCADVYSDLNNDAAIDREDLIGMYVNNYNNIDSFFYGMGGIITERDKDGMPVLALNSEKTANIISSIYQLLYETDGVFESGSEYTSDVKNRERFAEDGAMFLPGFFYTAEAMRDMESDYGIIPFPKLDSAQDEYHSIVHDIIRIMFLPSNCTKVDASCAVLEELAFRGYSNVLPEYYNVLMKNKYARDDISASMIDIIRDGLMNDIGIVYNFNGMGHIARSIIQGKSDNFASKYAELEPAALVKIDEHIELFMSIE